MDTLLEVLALDLVFHCPAAARAWARGEEVIPVADR
jgi:hypothetical protein